MASYWLQEDGSRIILEDDSGFVLLDQPPFILADSANIAASAATATTAQLTPPSGKTTANHQASRISDDTNPLPSVDPATNVYLEPEFAVLATDDAIDAAVYEFRITDNGTPFDTYSVTPQWTISTAAPPSNPTTLFAGFPQ